MLGEQCDGTVDPKDRDSPVKDCFRLISVRRQPGNHPTELSTQKNVSDDYQSGLGLHMVSPAESPRPMLGSDPLKRFKSGA